MHEIKRELIHSKRLEAHFVSNPDDLNLLKHDRPLATARKQEHLANVPTYLKPDTQVPLRKRRIDSPSVTPSLAVVACASPILGLRCSTPRGHASALTMLHTLLLAMQRLLRLQGATASVSAVRSRMHTKDGKRRKLYGKSKKKDPLKGRGGKGRGGGSGRGGGRE